MTRRVRTTAARPAPAAPRRGTPATRAHAARRATARHDAARRTWHREAGARPRRAGPSRQRADRRGLPTAPGGAWTATTPRAVRWPRRPPLRTRDADAGTPPSRSRAALRTAPSRGRPASRPPSPPTRSQAHRPSSWAGVTGVPTAPAPSADSPHRRARATCLTQRWSTARATGTSSPRRSSSTTITGCGSQSCTRGRSSGSATMGRERAFPRRMPSPRRLSRRRDAAAARGETQTARAICKAPPTSSDPPQRPRPRENRAVTAALEPNRPARRSARRRCRPPPRDAQAEDLASGERARGRPGHRQHAGAGQG